jgi:hypothetical protein
MKQLFIIQIVILTLHTGLCQGLEDIIVEKYYISDKEKPTFTGWDTLPKGSVTYRIYVDMAPGYRLNTLYGNENHLLRISTTTYFYNDPVWGTSSGDRINHRAINLASLVLDSWLSVGAATNAHHGVLLSDDTDGSIISKELLMNADGLMEGEPPVMVPFNLNLKIFEDATDLKIFETNNGAWGVFQLNRESTPENRVLIAQLTTDGQLSFELNIQLGTPDCGDPEIYVARDPADNEILFDKLIYGE